MRRKSLGNNIIIPVGFLFPLWEIFDIIKLRYELYTNSSLLEDKMGNKKQKKDIFFAYQSGPSDNVDAIKSAINDFNKLNNNEYDAKTWESLKINGSIINRRVLEAIDKAEVFACDLTHLNHNVLFELGYAIGKRKQLFLILNESFKEAKENFSNFKILKNIGYTSFTNSKDIIKGMKDKKDFDTILLEELVKLDEVENNSLDIFYIHSSIKNQAEIEIQDKLGNSNYKIIRDDVAETEFQTLSWYIQALIKSKSVVIHFLGKDKTGHYTENAQHSLYAGLACGLQKRVLLIAPSPFNAPIDYTEILVEYTDANSCVYKVFDWLKNHVDSTSESKPITALNKEEHDINLLKLGLGCEIAEEEKDKLLNYFIETRSYQLAFEKTKTIFVGRKGAGKSALYIKLKNELCSNELNYIIALKPESSELLENIEVSNLYNSEASKKSFFLNVWKFVVFSNLIMNIANRIRNKNVIQYSNVEDKILSFVEKFDSYINLNFFGVVKEINKKINHSNIIDNPDILNSFNNEYLSPLISLLREYFKNTKYFKIFILADNLDKTWDSKNDLSVQSEMILTLLEYAGHVQKEFVNKSGNNVDVKAFIFLRKDIFDFVKRQAREPDKLTIDSHEINWEDFPKLLQKLIEARFRYILDLDESYNMELIWKEYFDLDKKKHAFDMIKDACVLRPRDIIYFVSKLFESAINNSHSIVQFNDFEYAVNAYTSFLHMNLIAETSAEFPKIDEILSKLQENFGQPIDYYKFKGIISSFEHDEYTANKLIEALFAKGYLVGIDKKGDEIFSDIIKLNEKLNTKSIPIIGRFFKKKIYIIAHPKYQIRKVKQNMLFA